MAGSFRQLWLLGVVVLCVFGAVTAVTAVEARAGALDDEIQRSNAKEPAVGKVRIEPRGRRAAVRFAVEFPGIGRGSSPARVTARVLDGPDGRVLARRSRSDRTGGKTIRTYRVKFSGQAGRKLAGAKRRREAPLRLLEISVTHSRDLGGSAGADHVWHALESGSDLRGEPSPPLGSFLNTTASLLVKAPSDGQPYVLSSGNMTCFTNGGAFNNKLVGGPGNPISRSANIKENNGPIVETSLGVGANQESAATLWSMEARTFAFEMNVEYDAINLEPPRAVLRYAPLLNPLSSGATPCSSAQNTFVLAADSVQTGQHTAQAFLLKRASSSNAFNPTMNLTTLPNGVISQGGLAWGVQRTGKTGTAFSAQIEVQPSVPNLTGPCPVGSAWMECAFPAGSAKESRTLAEVIFPGSHDTATAALDISEKALESDTKYGCSGYDKKMRADMPIVRNWAVAQTLNMREQLDAGIRYLDMRASFDGDDWRANHSMYSQAKLEQDAQAIATWAKQHPRELVVVDFDNVCPLNGGNVDDLIEILDTPDPFSGADLCNTAYKIRSDANPNASDLASRTLADVRQAGGNVIVLLKQVSEHPYNDAVLQRCGFATEGKPNYSQPQPIDDHVVPTFDEWPDAEGPPGVAPSQGYTACADPAIAQGLNQGIEAHPYNTTPSLTDYRQRTPVPFFQTQMIYTLRFPPDDPIISAISVSLLLPGCPDTLIEWEDALKPGGSPHTRAQILADWGTNTNMVITDSVDNAYISQAVNLNN